MPFCFSTHTGPTQIVENFTRVDTIFYNEWNHSSFENYEL
jgi:hypothetical protein